jgi:hypothetical protein
MAHRVLTYRTETSAKRAKARLLKRYPVHPDCKVEVVFSALWDHPWLYVIQVTGKDGRPSYWSSAK